MRWQKRSNYVFLGSCRIKQPDHEMTTGPVLASDPAAAHYYFYFYYFLLLRPGHLNANEDNLLQFSTFGHDLHPLKLGTRGTQYFSLDIISFCCYLK